MSSNNPPPYSEATQSTINDLINKVIQLESRLKNMSELMSLTNSITCQRIKNLEEQIELSNCQIDLVYKRFID